MFRSKSSVAIPFTVMILSPFLTSAFDADVRENSSSSKADVRKGDKIITVNGIATEDLDLNVINGYLNSKPGRKISLKILRDGITLKKEFRLENVI